MQKLHVHYISIGACEQVRIPIAAGGKSNEAFCLTLPGNPLDLSILLNKEKKFRRRGGKDAALQALRNLEEDGLVKLEEKRAKGSVKVGTCTCMCIHVCVLDVFYYVFVFVVYQRIDLGIPKGLHSS